MTSFFTFLIKPAMTTLYLTKCYIVFRVATVRIHQNFTQIWWNIGALVSSQANNLYPTLTYFYSKEKNKMAFPEFIEFPHTGFGTGRLISGPVSTTITFPDFIELPHTGAGTGWVITYISWIYHITYSSKTFWSVSSSLLLVEGAFLIWPPSRHFLVRLIFCHQ